MSGEITYIIVKDRSRCIFTLYPRGDEWRAFRGKFSGGQIYNVLNPPRNFDKGFLGKELLIADYPLGRTRDYTGKITRIEVYRYGSDKFAELYEENSMPKKQSDSVEKQPANAPKKSGSGAVS